MGYRKDSLAVGSIYHVYNRGVNKGLIVRDRHDRQRWLDTLDYYRFKDVPIQFSLANQESRGTIPLIRILAYCLMPNHFHLLLEQLEDQGISTFLRRATVSYSRYHNTRWDRVGPLFQGRFQNRWIQTTELLIHVSRYIHLNPYVARLCDDLKTYRWSSYPTYLNPSQMVSFCDPKPILQLFKSSSDYERFVLDHSEYARNLEIIKHLTLD